MPIGQACRLHNGRAYGLHEWEQSGVPVIRLQNLTGGNDYYFSNLKLADNKYCDHGDLLFMWSATFGPRIWLGERAIYHYHIWKVVPKADVATKAYLFHKFESITEEKKAHSTNGGTMLHFTKSDMEGTLIAVPGVAEQESIANALSDADALIESLAQLIAKKRQIKQGAMQELLTGKRRLPGFSGDWEDRSLFELAGGRKELFDDGDWIESEHITEDGIRLIQTGNIGVGSFIEKGEKKYISEESFGSLRCKEIKQGDLLICRLAEPAGRACVLPELGESKTITSVDVTIFRPPLSVANRVFLANVFSTAYWFNEVSDRSGGTTHKRISRGSLGGIRVTIPQLDEQTAIATILSDMDTELAALESRLAKARQIKQGMMQELLTGRIRLL